MCGTDQDEDWLEMRSMEYINLHGLEKCDFDDACDRCSSPTGGSWVQLCHIPEDVTEANFYICWECIKARAALDWCEICGRSTGEGINLCQECEHWESLIDESDFDEVE